MQKNIELLAPGGDIDSIKAAIQAGADAVYCGLDKFNARNRAANIRFDDLNGILGLAHRNGCRVFLTLNIIFVEREIPAVVGLLNKLLQTSVDGIIVQDLGLLYILSQYFKGLKIHASTQLTTHNEGQIRFLKKLSVTRVNLSRELNIKEIKLLTGVGHQNDISIEIFVHGSNCICFSGICYISSVHGGNSGNRGRCSQPCRDPYVTTPRGKNFPLNLKDNSAYLHLKEIDDAGVDSIKIEGRIKKFHYVYTVVSAWKQQIQNLYNGRELIRDNSVLYSVFNRDFSNTFLTGDIHKDMFIDNPRDHSAIHLSETYGSSSDENMERAKGEIFVERTEWVATVEKRLQTMSIGKTPLRISISGECGTPLEITVTTPDTSFVVRSEMNLTNIGAQTLNRGVLLSRLKALNDTEYVMEHLSLEKLPPNLFIPFSELTSIKKRLLFILNGSREAIDTVEVPVLRNHPCEHLKPSLSVLISSTRDLNLSEHTTANIYFQLPNCFHAECSELIHLFLQNPTLIPWFPSVCVGEDYIAALEFLKQVRPKNLVTDNTGIGYEAFNLGIPWIAGPHLNLVNSFSLLCLKENFNCAGAFLSNEISKMQIRGIKKPDHFELYYSIYQPLVLMTSRQCLFHQVTGCSNDKIEDNCIQQCVKSSSITNLKEETFFIEKSKGNYHCLYNEFNFLNTDIVVDFPNHFTGFFVDLRDVVTSTRMEGDKGSILKMFEDFLAGYSSVKEALHQRLYPTTNAPYIKGI